MTATPSELKTIIAPATLAGRCANGHERGAGVVVHAVECAPDDLRFGIPAYTRSLCGKTHGARSAGWCERLDLEITCPKCLKALAQREGGNSEARRPPGPEV